MIISSGERRIALSEQLPGACHRQQHYQKR